MTYRPFGWKLTVTPLRLGLLALMLIGIGVMLVRLVTGFGTVTHLNDHWPWGLWIAIDVMTGVALAGGGYSTALIVHVLHRDRYHPIARGALLTSLFGYLMVMAGLFLDIGQWHNFWRPFVSWGHSSVLFEVFWCVSIYTTIQLLEFGEIVTEKIGVRLHGWFKKIVPILMIIGVVFPTIHQSSLGGLFLIAAHKLHPLWASPFLPLFFLLSSFFVGPAMICVETALAGWAFGHRVPLPVLIGLTRIGGASMVLYAILKIGDLVWRGALPFLWSNTLEGNFFLLEIGGGVLLPLAVLLSPLGRTRRGLVLYGLLTAVGVIGSRLNVVFTGMLQANGGSYFPSLGEFAVTLGLVAAGCLAYCFVVENFNIFGSHEEETLTPEQN